MKFSRKAKDDISTKRKGNRDIMNIKEVGEREMGSFSKCQQIK